MAAINLVPLDTYSKTPVFIFPITGPFEGVRYHLDIPLTHHVYSSGKLRKRVVCDDAITYIP
jgi:hypothetical protein